MLIVLRILLAVLSFALIARTALAASVYETAQPAVAGPTDKIALSDALAMAERRVHDGRVLEAVLKLRDGHRAWDVEMVRHGKNVTVWIDAGDGTLKVQTAPRR